MHAVIWLLAVLVVELAVALVLLGTWVAEGRRRADEIERLEALARRFAEPSAPAEAPRR